MSVVVGEPIISRLDRLDIMMSQLEEIRGDNRLARSFSGSSNLSSGTPTSEGGVGSSTGEFSPKSLEKHCRPVDRVIMETELKGSLVERLDQIEQRMLKLVSQLSGELEPDKKHTNTGKKKTKGWKKLISCR